MLQDSKNYGSLDNVSCFPFESFLGQIKTMVRRPDNAISPVVRRYAEKIHISDHNFVSQLSDTNAFKQQYFGGPLPNSYSHCFQYKKYFGKFLVSLSKRDNCFIINKEVAIVKNILVTQNKEVFVVIQRFLQSEPFFNIPLNSKLIGIYVVTQLDSKFDVVPVSELHQKVILLPFQNSFVAIVLAHKDSGKFLVK